MIRIWMKRENRTKINIATHIAMVSTVLTTVLTIARLRMSTWIAWLLKRTLIWTTACQSFVLPLLHHPLLVRSRTLPHLQPRAQLLLSTATVTTPIFHKRRVTPIDHITLCSPHPHPLPPRPQLPQKQSSPTPHPQHRAPWQSSPDPLYALFSLLAPRVHSQ